MVGLQAISAQDTIVKKSKVIIENADRSISKIVNKEHIQYLQGNVRVIQDSIFMFCDSAVLKKNQLTAIGDVIIIQNDSIKMFSDSLVYDGDNKIAKMFESVVLEKRGQQIFTESLIYNLDSKHAIFNDTCLLVKGTMNLSSLRANYNVKSNLAFFYDDVTIIDGDFKMKTDSLMYDTDIDRAYFIAPSFIEQNKKRIYAKDGFYDLLDKRAYFSDFPVYFSGDQFAKAENMYYSGIDSVTILSGDAFIKDSLSEAKAELITQNDKEKLLILEGNASYLRDGSLIEGPKIIYHQKSKNIFLEGRSTVNMNEGVLKGDTINYIDSIDFGTVRGEAFWLDTIDNRSIEGELFYYKKKDSYFKAVSYNGQRPLIKQKIKEDTIYFSADTLINVKMEDSISYMKAIRNVRIYKSDLQAVCDSLYYSENDSTIYLYGQPIVWSDTTQFTGDTIQLVIKDDEISEILARNKAFIISNESAEYYNQIKGRYIHAYLDSNQLDRMVVKGNSESIYFIKDDENAFVGPNYTICSHMTFYFAAKELKHVKYYTEPESVLTPMKKARQDQFQLKNFVWHEANRPRVWKDVLKVFRSKTEISERPEPADEFESAVEKVIRKKISNDSEKSIKKKE